MFLIGFVEVHFSHGAVLKMADQSTPRGDESSWSTTRPKATFQNSREPRSRRSPRKAPSSGKRHPAHSSRQRRLRATASPLDLPALHAAATHPGLRHVLASRNNASREADIDTAAEDHQAAQPKQRQNSL